VDRTGDPTVHVIMFSSGLLINATTSANSVCPSGEGLGADYNVQEDYLFPLSCQPCLFYHFTICGHINSEISNSNSGDLLLLEKTQIRLQFGMILPTVLKM